MNTRICTRFVTMVVGTLCAAGVLAADDIVLRASTSPTEAWVGQKVVLRIEVLAKDGWAQLPKIGDAEVPGAYWLRLESQGIRLNETIDGDSYSGQRYEFMLFAQQAGTLKVPPVPVDIEIRRYGANAETQNLQQSTPAVEFVARVPPGAEGIRGLVSTNRLTASQQWEPAIENATAGDALTRTITLQADDLSGMAFTPLMHEQIDGVGAYPAEPQVDDQAARGALTGTRVEAVTYIFERPGTYTLPDLVVPWWDVREEVLKRHELAGLTVQVAGSDLATLPAAQSSRQPNSEWPIWLPVLAGLAGLAVILIALRNAGGLRIRWAAWQKSRNDREIVHFQRVLKSLQAGERKAALRQTMRWLDRINENSRPARLDRFLEQYGEDGLHDRLLQFFNDRAAKPGRADVGPMVSGLSAARRRWLRNQRIQSRANNALAELNGAV